MAVQRVFGFAGWSGSGKTTLIEQLIARFNAHGLTVSLIKHAHHAFDIDQPGKDSFRHREAGCREVLVTSVARWALQHELRGQPELTLDAALQHLSPCDLVLVEGFKAAAIAKLEVYRAEVGKPLLHPRDPEIVAVASDAPVATALPVLPLGDPDVVATFILRYLGLAGTSN
jgi:molybdopterin-guanine dinucleotide biosynthesis protein B